MPAQPTLLIVDGTVEHRETYNRYLSQANPHYRITAIESGYAALQWCQHALPDLILLNVCLPDLDGLEVLNHLHAITTRALPSIVLLANPEQEAIAIQALTNGAQDYLVTSTLTADSLNRTVRYALEQAHLKHQLVQQQAQHHLISTIALRVRQSLLSDVFTTTVELLRSFLGADRVLICQRVEERKCDIVAESIGTGWTATKGCQIEDPEDLPRLEQGEVKAPLVISIRVERQATPILPDGIMPIWGFLVVQECSTPRQWSNAERCLGEEIGVQVAIAIQQAELYQQVQLERAERQKTEAESRQAAMQHQIILDALPDLVIRMNRQGTYLDFRAAKEFSIVMPYADMRGRDIREVMPPDIAAERLHYIEKALETGKTQFYEYSLQIQAQSYWQEARIAASGADEVIVVVRDITVQKQAEIERKQLNQILEERVKSRTLALEVVNEQLHQEVRIRRLAEVLLRSSQSRFQKLAANVPGAIYQYLLHADGVEKMSYVSSGIENLCGLKAAVVMTDMNLLWDLIDQTDIPKLRELIHHSATTLQPWQAEFRITTPSGQLKWLQGIARPEQLQDGTTLWDGFLIDITIRKIAEQKNYEQKTFLQTVLDNTPNLIFCKNTCGKYVLANLAVAKLHNTTAEALIGKTDADINPHPIEVESFGAIDRAVIQTRQPQTVLEETVTAADGTCQYFQTIKVPLLDANGHITGVLGVATNITERKQIQDALQQQIEREHLIAAMTQRMRETLDLPTILNTTVVEAHRSLGVDRVLVYRTSPEGTSKAIAEAVIPGLPSLLNTAFAADSFSPGYPFNSSFPSVQIFSEQDYSRYTRGLTTFLHQVGVKSAMLVPIVQQNLLWGFLAIHQCQTCQEWHTWEIQLLQQLANQLAIATKQSELYEQLQVELKEREWTQEQLRQMNQQLLISNTQLERATRLKDEFLANMSHELRTPLNAILGLSEGLLDQICGPITDKQKKAIATIERNGKHLLDLITDILDLAKIEAGKLDLQLTPVPVKQLCVSALNLISPLALKKSIQLTTQIPDSIQVILIDERRIQQVLLNLLSNAVKFTPNGGKVLLKVAIELLSCAPSSESMNANLLISVIDTGIGIEPHNLDKLFQSFVQVDSSLNRQYSGTGLGLGLVKRLVELHGGSVSVASEIEKGSCFTIKLPYEATPLKCSLEEPSPRSKSQRHPPRHAPLSSTLQSTPSSSQPEQTPPLILIAEDNQANLDIFSTYLVQQGYCLRVARDGVTAVSLAKQHQPHLILMDIQMPIMSGLEAIRLIRTHPELLQIPIIALTALAMPGDREKCLAIGANDYLAKPVRLKQLVELIHHHHHLTNPA